MTFSKNGRLGCDRLSAQDRPTRTHTKVTKVTKEL